MRYIYTGIARDEEGFILASATISIYLAGTSTAASVYVSKTSAVAVNSVTADSTGVFTFYTDYADYDAEQHYKLVVSKAGYTSKTYDYVAMPDVCMGTYSITTNTSISTHMKVPKGVLFAISTGVTLTINGPFEAGLYQVFSCTGTGKVAFGSVNASYIAKSSVSEIHPEWWGAVGDGSTDDYTAIQACLDASHAVYGSVAVQVATVRFRASHYVYKTTLEFDVVSTNKGSGWGTVLDYQGSSIAVKIQSHHTGSTSNGVEPWYCVLEDLLITTTSGTPTGGVYWGADASYTSYISGTMRHVAITGFDQTNAYGIKIAGGIHNRFIDCLFGSSYDNVVTDDTYIPTTTSFSNCEFRGATRYGAYITSAQGITFESQTVFEANNSSGLYVTGAGTVFQLSLNECWFENNCLTVANRECVIKGTGTGANVLSAISMINNYFGSGVAATNLGNVEIAYVYGFYAVGNGWASGSNPNLYISNTIYLPFIFGNQQSSTYTSGYAEQIDVDVVKFMNSGDHDNIVASQKASYYGNSVPGDGATVTTIAEQSESVTEIGKVVKIFGMNATGTKRFIDIIDFTYNCSATIYSGTGHGAPGARTYSNPSATTLGILIANDGETYRLRVVTVAGW